MTTASTISGSSWTVHAGGRYLLGPEKKLKKKIQKISNFFQHGERLEYVSKWVDSPLPERRVKNSQFWDDIVYGRPHTILFCQKLPAHCTGEHLWLKIGSVNTVAPSISARTVAWPIQVAFRLSWVLSANTR